MSGEPVPGANLSMIEHWLFDMDNTLYPEATGFMGLIQQKIGDYVIRTSGLPSEEALALQRKFLLETGTTLSGLMAAYPVDAQDFLDVVHDVPLDLLQPDADLRLALQRLPGQRLVFTNGSARHAERVMEKLQLADLFDGVFAIEHGDLIPKPDPRTFARLIGRFDVEPSLACFFEDTARNLKPAKDLGMTTVLVRDGALACEDPFVDWRTDDLTGFLNAALVKETA